MASQVGGLFHDRSLNFHYNGASAGGKSNVSKASRKGGLGVRKPLGDLSNSVKASPNQSLKNSRICSLGDKEVGASKTKTKIHGSPKKGFSKASSGRKAFLTSQTQVSQNSHLHSLSKLKSASPV